MRIVILTASLMACTAAAYAATVKFPYYTPNPDPVAVHRDGHQSSVDFYVQSEVSTEAIWRFGAPTCFLWAGSRLALRERAIVPAVLYVETTECAAGIYDTELLLVAAGSNELLGTGKIRVQVLGDPPPKVQIVTPSPGSVLAGTVRVQSKVSSRRPLRKVEAFIDGGLLPVGIISDYSFDFDTTHAADGPHELQVRATDDSSAVGEASVRVTILNASLDEKPPLPPDPEPEPAPSPSQPSVPLRIDRVYPTDDTLDCPRKKTCRPVYKVTTPVAPFEGGLETVAGEAFDIHEGIWSPTIPVSAVGDVKWILSPPNGFALDRAEHRVRVERTENMVRRRWTAKLKGHAVLGGGGRLGLGLAVEESAALDGSNAQRYLDMQFRAGSYVPVGLGAKLKNFGEIGAKASVTPIGFGRVVGMRVPLSSELRGALPCLIEAATRAGETTAVCDRRLQILGKTAAFRYGVARFSEGDALIGGLGVKGKQRKMIWIIEEPTRREVCVAADWEADIAIKVAINGRVGLKQARLEVCPSSRLVQINIQEAVLAPNGLDVQVTTSLTPKLATNPLVKLLIDIYRSPETIDLRSDEVRIEDYVGLFKNLRGLEVRNETVPFQLEGGFGAEALLGLAVGHGLSVEMSYEGTYEISRIVSVDGLPPTQVVDPPSQSLLAALRTRGSNMNPPDEIWDLFAQPIGAAGGLLRSASATLSVGPGAVGETVDVIIKPVANPPLDEVVGAVAIEPRGLALRRPALLTLRTLRTRAAASEVMPSIAYLPPGSDTWRPIRSWGDPAGGGVSANIDRFGMYALIKPHKIGRLNDLRIYPNPYKPNNGRAEDGVPYDPGNANSGIIFDQLPADTTIRIYTITGQLVAETHATAGTGKVQWDASNGRGKDVSTGVYLVVINNPDQGAIVRKIAIVR